MQAHEKEGVGFQEIGVLHALTYREVVGILRLLKATDHCESVELSAGEFKLKFRRSPEHKPASVQAGAKAPPPTPVTVLTSRKGEP